MTNQNVVSTRKKLQWQDIAINTTDATASVAENDDDKEMQTMDNPDSENQRNRCNDVQVSCNNKTSQLSNMANHPSDKQWLIERLNHNDIGNI